MGGQLVAADAFRPEEARALAASLRRGEVSRCPRCGGRLATSRVRRPPEVSYVRTRWLVVCPACRVSAAVDA